MRIKICGITELGAAEEIVRLGATALGFICVEQSPRYILPQQIAKIITGLNCSVDTIGVFANAELAEIVAVVEQTKLTGVQLHGTESPEFCQDLRNQLPPEIELIKAFRVKDAQTLQTIGMYQEVVDTLLLDAYHPQILGGTGHTLNWQDLQQFAPSLPWLLAGGLNSSNVDSALQELTPDGIDLSSGVERSPGKKDLVKVRQLFASLKSISP